MMGHYGETPVRERRKLQSEQPRPRPPGKKRRPFGLRTTYHYTASSGALKNWRHSQWYPTEEARTEARKATEKKLLALYDRVTFEELSR